jgi:hypothetical protein
MGLNILGLGLGLFGGVGGLAAVAARFVAPALFSAVAGPVVKAAWSAWSFVRGLDPRTIAAALAAGAALFLYVELRDERKSLAGELAWGVAVMVEVDRAHGCEPLRRGCAVDKGDAAASIHQLTDNARAWRADVERQNASQRESAQAAAARDAAARAAASTTADQDAREAVRTGLRVPDRKTGVSSNEWSKM